MVRRIASQVHKQASRLIQAQYMKEPAWYQAVLAHPPLPLPPKAPAKRSAYDLPVKEQTPELVSKQRRPHDPTLSPIRYIEDDIRRQFFMDHPLEAFRPRTLVEAGEIEPEHPLRGKAWTRLRQRGRNPSSEDAIKYAVNLHEAHEMPLTEAYKTAVAQFRALRSEHDIAKTVALMEAEAMGLEFGPATVDKNYLSEEKMLQSWGKKDEQDAAAQAARKRWRAVIEKEGIWTRGEEYTRLWQEGVRPTYSPAVDEAASGVP